MSVIVVGTDESLGSAAALRWAAAEGARRKATVRAVLAWTYLDQRRGPGVEVEFDPQYSEASAEEALDLIIADVLGPDASVERRVVNDHAGRALVEAASDADLLVVGARGLGGVRSVVLGSVSGYCAHHASCPVVVVRAEDVQSGHDRIVVGVDGSEASATALAWAVEEAALRGSKLEVLHAWMIPALAGPYVGDVTPVATAAQALVEEMVAAAGVAADDTTVVARAVMGAASGALIDASADADLVVVSSRGRGGFAGLLLGSVSHQVAAHAACPAVIVRR